MASVATTALSRRRLLAGASATVAAGLAGSAFVTPAHSKAPMLNTQAPSFYRFKLGNFEGTVISDGPLGNVGTGYSVIRSTEQRRLLNSAWTWVPVNAASKILNSSMRPVNPEAASKACRPSLNRGGVSTAPVSGVLATF